MGSWPALVRCKNKEKIIPKTMRSQVAWGRGIRVDKAKRVVKNQVYEVLNAKV